MNLRAVPKAPLITQKHSSILKLSQDNLQKTRKVIIAGPWLFAVPSVLS